MGDIKKIFKCTRCGFCCQGETTVSLNQDDRTRMIHLLGDSSEAVAHKYWRVNGTVVQMKTVDGHCIFYDNGCKVHPGRPWRCAQWPLVPALLHDRDSFQIISDSCPGINKDLDYDTFCEILRNYLEKSTEQD